MLPGVLSNPELKQSTDVIYSAVYKELCVALVEEMDGAGIKAAAHTSGQLFPWSWGHALLWELLPALQSSLQSFQQGKHCRVSSSVCLQSSAEARETSWCCSPRALSRLLTLRAHPDSRPASAGQPACGSPGFPSPALASSGLFPLLDRALHTH